MDDVRYIRVAKNRPVGLALGIAVDRDFEIAMHPVSVTQYEAFCAATGYQTMAERRGLEGSSFRDSSTLYELSVEDRAKAPAVHLCYIDALAFCAGRGVVCRPRRSGCSRPWSPPNRRGLTTIG